MSGTQDLELHEVPDDVSIDASAPVTVPPSEPSANRKPAGANRKYAAQLEGRKQVISEPEMKPEVDENGHRLVLVDDEIFTVVEGDLALDPDQKELWMEGQQAKKSQFTSRLRAEAIGFGEAALTQGGTVTSYLVGIVQDGKVVRWPPGTVLTYCVLLNTFPRQEWYEELVANMPLATADWEAVCGVQFRYVPELDTSPSVRPEGVLFPVRYISAGGAFIAASFFPNDPKNRRRMLIDPSYFTTSFDHVGVLRHELGHVLGFRHEHIRSGAPAVCPHEDTTGTINFTNYDPQSVMHYFCGGVGSKNLEITAVDRNGAQQLYGPPISTFQHAEV
jgi:hypothetical protein